MSKETKHDQIDKQEKQPYRVRLPGFVTEEEIGLGDVIKRATSSVGIQSCDGCAQRAATLNRWLVISPWWRG